MGCVVHSSEHTYTQVARCYTHWTNIRMHLVLYFKVILDYTRFEKARIFPRYMFIVQFEIVDVDRLM